MDGSPPTVPICSPGSVIGARVAEADRPLTIAAKPENVVSGPSLRRNISWTLLGNLIYAACQWGVLIAIARLGDTVMLGQFAMALAICTPVFMLAGLNLRYVLVTDSANRFQAGDYISLRLLTTAAATAVVSVMASAIPDVNGPVLVAVAVVKATESFSDVIHGIRHKREQFRAICIATAVRGLSSLFVVIAALAATWSLIGALVGLVVVNLLVLILVDLSWPLKGMLAPSDSLSLELKWDRARLVSLTWLALPVGLAALILSLNTSVPRYFIAWRLDEAALGQFAAAAYLLIATDILVQSSRTSALPRLSRLFAQERHREFWQLTGKLMLLGAACTIPAFLVVAAGGEAILVVIYGPEFRGAADAFLWLMAANVVWQSSVPSAVLLAMQRYWTDLGIRVASTIVIAFSAWLLVADFGLVGAAWSILAGRIVGTIGTTSAACLVLHRQRRDCRNVLGAAYFHPTS